MPQQPQTTMAAISVFDACPIGTAPTLVLMLRAPHERSARHRELLQSCELGVLRLKWTLGRSGSGTRCVEQPLAQRHSTILRIVCRRFHAIFLRAAGSL
jgi:hypothetical protein